MIESGSTPCLQQIDLRNGQISAKGMVDLAKAVSSSKAPSLKTSTTKKNCLEDQVVQEVALSQNFPKTGGSSRKISRICSAKESKIRDFGDVGGFF